MLLHLGPGSPPQVLLRRLGRLLTCRVRVPEQCRALCSPLRSSAVLMGRTLVSKRDQMVHLDSAFGPFVVRVFPSPSILT